MTTFEREGMKGLLDGCSKMLEIMEISHCSLRAAMLLFREMNTRFARLREIRLRLESSFEERVAGVAGILANAVAPETLQVMRIDYIAADLLFKPQLDLYAEQWKGVRELVIPWTKVWLGGVWSNLEVLGTRESTHCSSMILAELPILHTSLRGMGDDYWAPTLTRLQLRNIDPGAVVMTVELLGQWFPYVQHVGLDFDSVEHMEPVLDAMVQLVEDSRLSRLKTLGVSILFENAESCWATLHEASLVKHLRQQAVQNGVEELLLEISTVTSPKNH